MAIRLSFNDRLHTMVSSVDQRSEALPAAQPDERNASIGYTLYHSEPCARCGNHSLTGLANANVIKIRSIIHSHTPPSEHIIPAKSVIRRRTFHCPVEWTMFNTDERGTTHWPETHDVRECVLYTPQWQRFASGNENSSRGWHLDSKRCVCATRQAARENDSNETHKQTNKRFGRIFCSLAWLCVRYSNQIWADDPSLSICWRLAFAIRTPAKVKMWFVSVFARRYTSTCER